MEDVLTIQVLRFLLKETFIEQLKECKRILDRHFIEVFGTFGYPLWEEQAWIRFGTPKVAAAASEDITVQKLAKWKTRAAGGKAKKGKKKEIVAMMKSKEMGAAASMKRKEMSVAVMKGSGVGVASSMNVAAAAVNRPKVVLVADWCQACKVWDVPCYCDMSACMSCHAAKRKCEFLEGEHVLSFKVLLCTDIVLVPDGELVTPKMSKAVLVPAPAVAGGSREPSHPPTCFSFTSTKPSKMLVESEGDREFKDVGDKAGPAAMEVTELVVVDDDYALAASDLVAAKNSEYLIELAQVKLALWIAKNRYNTICNLYEVKMGKEWPGYEEFDDL